MERNATRIGAALVILGVVTILGIVVLGGRFSRPQVQIEFGSYPEVFQGMSVEIDGKPSGILQPSGSAHRTGFPVTEGRHTIRVVHPLYVSLERHVDVSAGGKPVLLVLDLQPTVDPRGQPRTAIGFQD